MKVKELIEKLSQYDSDSEVRVMLKCSSANICSLEKALVYQRFAKDPKKVVEIYLLE
jgi:hypothetical protein